MGHFVLSNLYQARKKMMMMDHTQQYNEKLYITKQKQLWLG
jgi:hypothetical protein